MMNIMTGVEKFILSWDSPGSFPSNVNKNDFQKNPLSSINIHGDYSNDSSVILTRNQNGFYSGIERGVKELTAILVEKMCWITYSSCEGHKSYQGVAYKKRVIQLLPRDAKENETMFLVLSKMADSTNERITDSPIKVRIVKELLQGDHKEYNTVKIIFHNNNCLENDYFSTIESVYADFITNFNG